MSCLTRKLHSFEENIFYIVAFFSLLNQAKFYRCQIGKGQDVISIKLSAKVTNVAKILSIDFLSQNEMSIPKVCTRRIAKRAINPEAEYLKERIKDEFHKEVVLLDSSGSLHVYKGDLPLISFLSDVDIPMLLSPNFEAGSVITDISNPKDSRLTLTFDNDEVKRVDLQFKGKFRDFVLQS